MLISCGEENKVREVSVIQERVGIAYAVNESEPYTGLLIDIYPNGQRKNKIFFKNGKEEGQRTLWYENGQKAIETHFKNGKEEGLKTSWYENGQKAFVINYTGGYKDGWRTSWYLNGQKHTQIEFIGGKKSSSGSIYWDKTGNKK